MPYRYEFKCPRCDKVSEAEADKPIRVINCGDCLMHDVEVVAMICTKVSEID
jgi:transcription elongation factor Elf1